MGAHDHGNCAMPATENPNPPSNPAAPVVPQPASAPRERPTPEGDALDPTRYGDWEKNGRCIDF